MTGSLMRFAAAVLLFASPGLAQAPDDPFPDRIPADVEVVRVNFVEFASLPDIGGGPARPTLLVDEPGTARLFVNDMRGPLYALTRDGRGVARYIDIDDPRWGVRVESSGRERGFQSFAFHPQFNQPGMPGFGKFYTWTDTENTAPAADFSPGGGQDSHDTVLLEWTARDPGAATYDGGPPRELVRLEQPFGNHNAGQLGFDPTVRPGDPDFGLLYIGVADGGSGGDPLDLAQNLLSPFGKILRIHPLGSNGVNGEYGIPAGNPFVGRGDVLGEIYAYGVRNPQRFAWDPNNGNLFLADIGQNIVEELSLVPSGGNLGWNDWEGSFRFISRSEVSLSGPRSDPTVTYPVAEYSQRDPLFQGSCCAITGVHVYRGGDVPALRDLVIFGDNPSGELFYIRADRLPAGGPTGIRRIVLNDGGTAKSLIEVIRAKNTQQGRQPATRVDLRLGSGPDGELFLLNKQDGVIRRAVR
ncbi:MAG TPA: PQQ-dependent sugar dehydrogenase [Longimicrobiaceae bacterium]|nr:PQQ-dependent sugar dehydrogenase [Longimicrobiaceae bacterium]